MFYAFELDRVPALSEETLRVPVVYNIKGTALCSDDVMSVMHMNVCNWGYELMPFGNNIPQEIGNIPDWLRVNRNVGFKNLPAFVVSAWYVRQYSNPIVIVEHLESVGPMPVRPDDFDCDGGSLVAHIEDTRLPVYVSMDVLDWADSPNDIERETPITYAFDVSIAVTGTMRVQATSMGNALRQLKERINVCDYDMNNFDENNFTIVSCDDSDGENDRVISEGGN